MNELERRLEWWCDEGLISDDQARQILAKEHEWEAAVAPVAAAPSPPGRRLSPIVEGLGYIGGILTLVGVVLLIARYWTDMSAPARLALGIGSAAVMLVGGLLIHESEPALVRLRWTLWTLSTVAAAVTVAVTMADAIDDVRGSLVALVVSGVVAVENGLLWAGRSRPIQQALFLLALPVVTGSAVFSIIGDDPPSAPIGAVVAVTGVAILVAGATGRTTYPSLTDGIGTAAIVVGVTLTTDTQRAASYLPAIAVAVMLIAVAFTPRLLRHAGEQAVVAAVAAFGLLQLAPPAVVLFAEQAAVATGLVVAAIGLVVLELGRRRLVEIPVLVMLAGGAALVGGFAITGVQSVAFATLAGLTVALVLMALGTRPGLAIMSVFGAVGLLVNVPWAIWWFFPGEGRAPLLVAVAGVLIIAAAVLLAGMRGRLRSELDQQQSAGGARSRVAPQP